MFIFFYICCERMYLKNVVIIGEDDDVLEIGNADDLLIENWSSFHMVSDNVNNDYIQFIRFLFNFKIVGLKYTFGDFGELDNSWYEIANEQLKVYEYKAVNMSDTETRMCVYRIPRTFTIAYNETHLISASMCANLYYLYWLLECKDIIRVMTEYLFNVVKYDYSLYTCVN